MIKAFYNKYILIILGFLIFTLYFWSRFLRERTSKILPLNLSIISFFILLYICCIFTYILISLLKSSSNKNPIIEKIIDWLFIPIMEFDNYLKSFSVIKNSYKKVLNYIIPKLEYSIIKTNLFYIIFWVFPRLILLTALFVDVFIYKQLHYKYMVILFGLLLFFNRYVKYCLKKSKKDLIEKYNIYINRISTPYVQKIHPAELEPDYDPNDPDEDEYIENMVLPLETYVEFQTNSIVYQNLSRKINYISSTKKLYNLLWQKHFHTEEAPENENDFKLTPQKSLIFEECRKFNINGLNKIMTLSILLEYYYQTTNLNKKLKNIKILIYLNYLLCWLYILIISIHTLNLYDLILVLNKTWLLIEDPFIQDFMYDILNKNRIINEKLV